MPDSSSQVVLVDTTGDLASLYAAADVAFVGGSLVSIGGHNLLEPASFGLPVLTGPSYFNARDIARLLLIQGSGAAGGERARVGGGLGAAVGGSGAAAAYGRRRTACGRVESRQRRAAAGAH